MKKAASLIVSLFIVAIIFSSGCLVDDTPEGTRGATQGADKGLEATFLPNSPPAELFPNNPFDVIVSVENKGEYDIPAGETYVFLAGLNPSLFNFNDYSISIGDPIMGVKKYGNTISPGEITRVEFNSDKGYTGPLGGDAPFTAIAKVCYKYNTSANAPACVTSLRVAPEDAFCVINSEKPVTNKGAPIKISKIEELPLGQPSDTEVTLGFNIYIENVAKGKPFLSQLTNCNSIDYEDLDRVKVESASLDNIELDVNMACTTGTLSKSCCWYTDDVGEVQLINGEGKILCQLTTDSTVQYVGVLQATLTYNYADQITKTFTIRKIGV